VEFPIEILGLIPWHSDIPFIQVLVQGQIILLANILEHFGGSELVKFLSFSNTYFFETVIRGWSSTI